MGSVDCHNSDCKRIIIVITITCCCYLYLKTHTHTHTHERCVQCAYFERKIKINLISFLVYLHEISKLAITGLNK